jgi:hypothetical protein
MTTYNLNLSARIAALAEALGDLHGVAQTIAHGGEGDSYSECSYRASDLVEKANEKLADICAFIAEAAGDGEDCGTLDELDRRITRLCDDREEDMCYAATGRYMRRHPDPDQARDEQIDRDLIDEATDDREARYDHWDA